MAAEDVASGGKFSLVSEPIIISLVLVLLTCIWSVVQVSNCDSAFGVKIHNGLPAEGQS